MITEQNHRVHLSAQDLKKLRDLREERPARITKASHDRWGRKIDALREQEIVQLLNIIQRLSKHLAPAFVAAGETEAAPHERA